MYIINRQKIKDKMDRNDFQAVGEVLDPDAYENFHLLRAVNVPFDNNFADKIQSVTPDKSQPVAVYCMDAQCDASPKAAHKMAELGYQQVYIYEAGRMAWKDAGMPIETYARPHSWKALYHPL